MRWDRVESKWRGLRARRSLRCYVSSPFFRQHQHRLTRLCAFQHVDRRGRLSNRRLCVSTDSHAPTRLAPVSELQFVGRDVRLYQSKSPGAGTVSSIASKIQVRQCGLAYIARVRCSKMTDLEGGLSSLWLDQSPTSISYYLAFAVYIVQSGLYIFCLYILACTFFLCIRPC